MRSVATIALSMLVCATASAQTTKDLVGAWQQVANVSTGADGTKADVFGPNPKGMLIMTPDGHFAVILHRPDIAKVASNNRVQGTPEENKAVVNGSIALYGSYGLDGKVLKLKVEGSTFPNWNGTDQTRDIIAFKDDEFTWRVKGSTGGTNDTTFRRVK
jgi:hypothetical protein